MKEQIDDKKFMISIKRLIIVGILILFVWGSLVVFLYFKYDEVTKDPCRICSERMGEKVICTTGETYISIRTYYPNGTINTYYPEVAKPIFNFNLTKEDVINVIT
jgi:hypothetical protein